MKTQLSVLVKSESMMGKANAHRFLGPFALLTKSTMVLIIDGETHELKENKKPYIFDLEPGKHVIQFLDPKKDRKEAARNLDKLVAGAMIGGIGALGGNAWLAFEGSDVDWMFGKVTEDGAAEINLREGDILKLSCKGTGKGVPKVKVLKK